VFQNVLGYACKWALATDCTCHRLHLPLWPLATRTTRHPSIYTCHKDNDMNWVRDGVPSTRENLQILKGAYTGEPEIQSATHPAVHRSFTKAVQSYTISQLWGMYVHNIEDQRKHTWRASVMHRGPNLRKPDRAKRKACHGNKTPVTTITTDITKSRAARLWFTTLLCTSAYVSRTYNCLHVPEHQRLQLYQLKGHSNTMSL
jgi:hypothetical protein